MSNSAHHNQIPLTMIDFIDFLNTLPQEERDDVQAVFAAFREYATSYAVFED